MSTIKQVGEFHHAFGQMVAEEPHIPHMYKAELEAMQTLGEQLAIVAKALHNLAERHQSFPLLRMQLMIEEIGEVAEAIVEGDVPGLLKELTDTQYVVDGTYLAFGLGRVKDVAFNAVHDSNMAKLDENGSPLKDEAGRVMKPEGWQKPDMSKFLL